MSESTDTQNASDTSRCLHGVVMRRSESCSNCRHLVKRDMSLMRYQVKASCAKGVWQGGEYCGDGDYAENDTEKQVCDLYEGA